MTGASPDRAFVVVRAPNGDVREVPVTSVAVVLGRDESCDVRVDDRKVSRRHASLRFEDGRLWVEDLGSINGVKLNGRKVDRRAPVGPDDVVLVGGYEIRLSKNQPRAATPAPAPVVSLPPEPGPPPAEVERDAHGLTKSELDKLVGRSLDDDPPALIGLDGPAKGKRFVLKPGENLVGRLEDCVVSVLDGSVSRHHAKISWMGGHLLVEDLESANGVFVNDAKVDREDLNNDDEVRFGRVRFRVQASVALSRRVGAVVPMAPASVADADVAPRRGSSRRAAALLAALAGLLVLAGVLVRFRPAIEAAARRVIARDAGALAGEAPDAETIVIAPTARDAEASLAVAPDAADPDPRPSAPELVGAPDAAPRPEAPPAPDAGLDDEEDPPALAEGRPPAAPPASLPVRTATSPRGRRDAKGWPLDLPTVDEGFDFDAFVGAHLASAEALETAGSFREVRRVLAELLERDPINGKARAILERVSRSEVDKKRREHAERLEAEGELLRAYKAYAEIPGPAADAGTAPPDPKLVELGQKIEAGLKASAEKLSADPKRIKAVHASALEVLDAMPDSKLARELVLDLERKLRAAKQEFVPYAPEAERERPVDRSEIGAAMAEKYKDRQIASAMETYAQGGTKLAIQRLEGIVRSASGAKKATAKGLLDELRQLAQSYARIRAEISNDPFSAWDLLLKAEKQEAALLPQGVESYARRELGKSIAETFGDRGAGLFEQKKYEEAFRHWYAGFRLYPKNPMVQLGLVKLEEKAEELEKESDLQLQRGSKSACQGYRRITKITRGTSEVHKRAKERIRQSAC